MKHDIEKIRFAMCKHYHDLLRAMRADYAANERDSNRTSSEQVYNSVMIRLRDLRCAIAHIDASDWDAFQNCSLGVFIVANYHASTMQHTEVTS